MTVPKWKPIPQSLEELADMNKDYQMAIIDHYQLGKYILVIILMFIYNGIIIEFLKIRKLLTYLERIIGTVQDSRRLFARTSRFPV